MNNSRSLNNNNQNVYSHLVFEGEMSVDAYDVQVSILPHETMLVTTAYRNSMGFTGGRTGYIQFNTPSGKVVQPLSNYVVPYGKMGELILFGSGCPKTPYRIQPWDREGNNYPLLELKSDQQDKMEWFGACLCREDKNDFFTVTRQGRLKRWTMGEQEIEQGDGVKSLKVITGAEEVSLFADRISEDSMRMVRLKNQIFVCARFGDYNNWKEEWFQYDPETNEVKGPLEESQAMILNAVPKENSFGTRFSTAKKIKGLKFREKVLATAATNDGKSYLVAGTKPLFPWSKKVLHYSVLCNLAE